MKVIIDAGYGVYEAHELIRVDGLLYWQFLYLTTVELSKLPILTLEGKNRLKYCSIPYMDGDMEKISPNPLA